MMHFIFAIIVFLPAILGVSLSDDLGIFSDSSADFFPVETSSDSAISFLDNNDDLFADWTGPMDFPSSANGLDSLVSDASCLSSLEGQPSARLRRQNAGCAPNGQPSIDGLINTLSVFGSLPETGKESEVAASFTNIDVGTPCPREFLGHLCCESAGEITGKVNIVTTSFDVYSTMTNCDSGTFVGAGVTDRPFDA